MTAQQTPDQIALDALKKIAYLRPAGDCKNKTIIAMERTALEAIEALRHSQPSPPDDVVERVAAAIRPMMLCYGALTDKPCGACKDSAATNCLKSRNIARAALAAAGVAGQWNFDIDEAPKDETPILLWATCGRWASENPERVIGHWGRNGWCYWGGELSFVRAWMPLPSPPAVKG